MKQHTVKDDPTGKIIFTQTDRMVEIDEEMTELEIALDSMRGPWRKPFNPEMRALSARLGKLGNEYWSLSEHVNPEYHAMKPCWKKTYGSISQ